MVSLISALPFYVAGPVLPHSPSMINKTKANQDCTLSDLLKDKPGKNPTGRLCPANCMTIAFFHHVHNEMLPCSNRETAAL